MYFSFWPKNYQKVAYFREKMREINFRASRFSVSKFQQGCSFFATKSCNHPQDKMGRISKMRWHQFNKECSRHLALQRHPALRGNYIFVCANHCFFFAEIVVAFWQKPWARFGGKPWALFCAKSLFFHCFFKFSDPNPWTLFSSKTRSHFANETRPFLTKKRAAKIFFSRALLFLLQRAIFRQVCVPFVEEPRFYFVRNRGSFSIPTRPCF